jgi:hypothetical protein
LNPDEVKTISLVGTDGSVRTTLSENDTRNMAEYFSHMEFDSKFNDSADAVRMVAPDYSLVISYKKSNIADDWMHIWITSGRTMFRSQWYFLHTDDLHKAATILSGYFSDVSTSNITDK